jgi:hypothetical protein
MLYAQKLENQFIRMDRNTMGGRSREDTMILTIHSRDNCYKQTILWLGKYVVVAKKLTKSQGELASDNEIE